MNKETPDNKETMNVTNNLEKSDEIIFKVPAPVKSFQPKRNLPATECSNMEVDGDTNDETDVAKTKNNVIEENPTCDENSQKEATEADLPKTNDSSESGNTPQAESENADSTGCKGNMANMGPVPVALVMHVNNLETSTNDESNENYRVILTGAQEKFHAIDSSSTNKVELEAEDDGPMFYSIKGPSVTKPFKTGLLPKAFESLPVFSSPQSKSEAESLKKKLLKDFACSDLTNEQINKLEMYCSPDNLCSGIELKMTSSYPLPSTTIVSEGDIFSTPPETRGEGDHFHTTKKYKMRLAQDTGNMYVKQLKYRGLRFKLAGQAGDGDEPASSSCRSPTMTSSPAALLVPGKDLLYRIRVYRPFPYSPLMRLRSGNRHPLLTCDVLLLGRHTLQDLRDKIECPNDIGLRIDISEQLDTQHVSSGKELFPSGFLFVNNVFYNDHRAGCVDYSATIREWAKKRDMGAFQTGDMGKQRLDQLTLKLGYPEVYVHQGDCEHLFTFSEIRLVGFNDPLDPINYPCTMVRAQNHSMYCTSCAEFAAKWIVTDCSRVPFDPAFFCDTCFKLYMYKDGKKVGNFKAYAYKTE